MELPTQLCCIGVLVVVSILFIIFGHIYREQVQLALKRDLFDLPLIRFDWWSLSHFTLFFIFGLIMPDHHSKFFLLGTAWELFEDMLSSSDTTQLVDCKNSQNKGHLWCSMSREDDYWYACCYDVLWNSMGYMFGSSIASQA